MGKLAGIVVVASAIGALLFNGVAQAQYAAPVGSVQTSASAFSTGPGNTVVIGSTVRAANGQTMAGVPATAEIIQEGGGPNGDAAVGSKIITKITDANGLVNFDLRVGSTPGVIVVRVSTANGMTSSVIVNVVGPAVTTVVPQAPIAVPVSAVSAPPPASAPLPPAAPVDQLNILISPPNTGDAGLVAPASSDVSWLALAAMALGSLVAVGLIARNPTVRSISTDGR